MACLAAVFGSPIASHAGRFNKVMNVGDAATAWSDLPGVDGRKHSLRDLRESKAVVVIFTCNHCPVATAYEKRFVRFTKEYQPRGVAVVAINVSRGAADGLDKMKERAREGGFNFTYVHDASQGTGRRFGATRTPQIFVLGPGDKNGGRPVTYMGAWDDDADEAMATRHFVRAAVDAALSGKKPDVTESRPRGCEIEFEKN